jgi:hypothetical protein
MSSLKNPDPELTFNKFDSAAKLGPGCYKINDKIFHKNQSKVLKYQLDSSRRTNIEL